MCFCYMLIRRKIQELQIQNIDKKLQHVGVDEHAHFLFQRCKCHTEYHSCHSFNSVMDNVDANFCM